MAALKARPAYLQADHRPGARADRSDHRTEHGPNRRSGRASLSASRGRSPMPMRSKATSGSPMRRQKGWLKGEVETAFARDGKFYDHDDGVRPDSSAENLAKLKPVFERPWGQVTAGNSSQITDGASWVILASEDAVAKHGLTPKAVIVDSQWSALDPSIMGLGPVLSATELLKRNQLSLAGHRDLGIERGVRDAGAGMPRRVEGRKILPRDSGPRRRRRRDRPEQNSMSTAARSASAIPSAAAATASCCIWSTR